METVTNYKSAASEAYRELRTNIQFSNIDKQMKVIGITSATPSEGKSTTSINLAITFAQAGQKTLIIDCDLRKPTLHKRLGLSKVKGLTSVLANISKFDESVQTYKKNQKLDALVCGPIPPNPAEMLGSQRMSQLIEKLKEVYDVIILDNPPLLAVGDALITSQLSDGVILVAAYNQVKKEQLVEAKKRLDKVKAPILGVCMNKVDLKKRKDYYYYYEK